MRGTARPIFQSEIRSAGVRGRFCARKFDAGACGNDFTRGNSMRGRAATICRQKKLRRSRDATPQLYLITFKKPFLFQREARYLLAVQVNLAP